MRSNKYALINIFLISWLFVTSSFASVQNEDPVVMLNGISKNLFAALKANREIVKNDVSKMEAIINKQVMPYADLDEMATWLAGKKVWAQALPEQKKSFLQSFRSLMIRTYGSALVEFCDYSMVFPNQKYDSTQSRIELYSVIERVNNSNIRVTYRLKNHTTSWKVYDLEVEGVSILKGFMAQFSQDIRNNGLDYVTAKINKHNSSKA